MRFPLFLLLSGLGLCHALWAEEAPLRSQFHRAPRPLAPGAVVEDWPRFLGPRHNATSLEAPLRHDFPADGPPLLWEVEKGLGHGTPAVAEGRVVLFHRRQGKERIDCLEAETGRAVWSFAYDAPYEDRMGSGDGPRTGPVIAGGRVFTFGVSGILHALDFKTGAKLWSTDCGEAFALQDNFFGHGGTPLVVGERLIVQLGGANEVCAAAFDCATGRVLWKARQPWSAGYASPIPATLHGKECVLLFLGGEGRPPSGGLVCLEVATGLVLGTYPHRAPIQNAVNASSPVVSGDRVFLTEAYGSDGVMLEMRPDFTPKKLWQSALGAHFMTPVIMGGLLIGCHSQSPQLAELICHEVESGRERWRNDLGRKFGRCSLLVAEGEVLALGEFGDLALLAVSPTGVKITAQAKLFHAPETWALPALSRGLLYVLQNDRSQDGKPPRLLCYDLRGGPTP